MKPTKKEILNNLLYFFKKESDNIYNYKWNELFEIVFMNNNFYNDIIIAERDYYNLNYNESVNIINDFELLYYGKYQGLEFDKLLFMNKYYKAVAYQSFELLDTINKYWNDNINKDTLKECINEIESVLYWL